MSRYILLLVALLFSVPYVAEAMETDKPITQPDTIIMVLAGLGLGLGMVMLVRSMVRAYKDAFEKDDWED